MEEVVESLVLSPFRDIVLKAKKAGQNARAAGRAPEAKEAGRAAHSLEREGERAVHKIEPLCAKLLETCGQHFIDALKDNDDIARYRTQLNDLLWEFDDYLELEYFDKDKFSELQALSRSCAPKIVDMLIRMKLEPSPREPVQTMAAPGDSRHRRPYSSAGDPTQPQLVTPGGLAEGNMTAQSGPDLGLDGGLYPTHVAPTDPPRKDSVHSHVSAGGDEPPPFPEKSPWRLGVNLKHAPVDGGDRPGGHAESRRRSRVPSPPPPASLPEASEASSARVAETSGFGGATVADERYSPQDPPSPLSPLQISKRSPSGGFKGADGVDGAHHRGQQTIHHVGRLPQRGNVHGHPLVMSGANGGAFSGPVSHSRDSSISESRGSPLFDSRTDSGSEMASPATASQRTSALSGPDPSQYPLIPEEQSSPWAADSGLIPVDAERSIKAPEPIPRKPADCSIGPSSSFYQMKGLCEGAKEIIRGGAGVRQVRKLNYGSGAVLAAKCKNCLYELDWNDVEADMNGLTSANYVSKSTGIGFRLRFLSKSHLPARTVEDQVYACLFCVQQGHTTEESDATVFFSQKQLFQHISRHPRPLPAVPGLHVIEGGGVPGSPGSPSSGGPEIVPAIWRNGFDLHLPQPSQASKTAAEAVARELDLLPTARSVETVRQATGTLRVPPDRASALQFPVGARIVGIEFPIQYGGEWAAGWYDNARGVFPAASVKLQPPPRDQIATQGGTNMCGIVRWKFIVKEKDRGDWLRLEKGESITNISWVYPGHWCWSGTNSRGRWGIFPRSHIDPSTLREEALADRASVGSHERRVSGLLARLSMRAPRPDSTVESEKRGPRMHIY